MRKKNMFSGFLMSLVGLLILLALVGVAIMAYTDFNLLLTIAFNNSIAYKIIATVVGFFGAIGLITLVVNWFRR